jgi:hypothetical protein
MSVPDPPWQAAPRARPARAPLSQDAIVHAALRVLDREGSAGLSMRRVAEELGTGPASLYWHVANKDALINLIIDQVASEIPLPEPDPDHWSGPWPCCAGPASPTGSPPSPATCSACTWGPPATRRPCPR